MKFWNINCAVVGATLLVQSPILLADAPRTSNDSLPMNLHIIAGVKRVAVMLVDSQGSQDGYDATFAPTPYTQIHNSGVMIQTPEDYEGDVPPREPEEHIVIFPFDRGTYSINLLGISNGPYNVVANVFAYDHSLLK